MQRIFLGLQLPRQIGQCAALGGDIFLIRCQNGALDEDAEAQEILIDAAEHAQTGIHRSLSSTASAWMALVWRRDMPPSSSTIRVRMRNPPARRVAMETRRRSSISGLPLQGWCRGNRVMEPAHMRAGLL